MPVTGAPARKPRTALVASITGVVGLVVGLAIGSLSGGGEMEAADTSGPAEQVDEIADEGPEDPAAAVSADEADDSETDDDPDPVETPEPTREPEEDATTEPEEGSRENPFAIGNEVGNEEWMIVLGEPREAWAEIQAENRYNDPPEEGFEYWIVPVTATYLGDETGNAGWDLIGEFVSSDGVTYDWCREVIPNPIRDVGELYEGGVAEGNVCLSVPAGADGLWTLRARLFGEPVFFEAGE